MKKIKLNLIVKAIFVFALLTSDVVITEPVFAGTTSITTGTVTTPFCAGVSFNLSYSKNGTFNLGNVFTAQLSSSSGSFASPTTIGTKTDTASGIILVTIPGGTSAGSGYRIRVVGSSPSTTGSDNGANITIRALPTANIITHGNVSCYGGSNGSANGGGSGGSAPYTFFWFPGGATTANISSLSNGTYNITVTDVNGCTGTNSVAVTQPSAVSSSISSHTNVSCYGGNNGSATVSASGGTGSLHYSWSNSATTTTISTLTPATYSVTVTDSFSCSATSSVTITQPSAPLKDSILFPNTINFYHRNAIVGVTGGTSPYTYSWSPSGGTAATASGLGVGTYSVLVTDNNGCTASASLTITAICVNGDTLNNLLASNINSIYPGLVVGGVISNHTLTINGTLTVDMNLQFHNCQVYMGTNAQIFINPSDTVTIDTTHIQGCQYMWNDIEMAHGHAHVIVKNHSVIEDGISAIYIVDQNAIQNSLIPYPDGTYDITNSTMRRNLIGINVNNFNDTTNSNATPGTVTGTIFNCNAPLDTATNTLYSLYTEYAILFANSNYHGANYHVHVGSNTADTNHFYDCLYGIFNSAGSLTAENNYFEILCDTCPGIGFTAVWSAGAVLANNDTTTVDSCIFHKFKRDITVWIYSSADIHDNHCYDADTGIWSRGQINSHFYVNIYHNYLTTMKYNAIISNPSFLDSSYVIIYKNVITDAHIGIWSFFNQHVMSCQITYNTITNSYTGPLAYGIVDQYDGNKASTISYNDITNMERGI